LLYFFWPVFNTPRRRRLPRERKQEGRRPETHRRGDLERVRVDDAGEEQDLRGRRERDATEVWQTLLDHSILIRNCASWDGLRGCLRVTIGTADENDRFLQALKETL